MKIDLVRIWASPSTLHLRVIYGADNGSWMKSRELHIPWESIPMSARVMLAGFADAERDEDLETPLF